MILWKGSAKARHSPSGNPKRCMVTRAGRGLVRSSTDRKSTRLNSSHVSISYAVFCLKKKKKEIADLPVTGIKTELLDEALEDRDELQREADLRLGRELCANATLRLAPGPRPDGFAIG